MANTLNSNGLCITSGDVTIPSAKLSTSRQILKITAGSGVTKTITINSPYVLSGGTGFFTDDIITMTYQVDAYSSTTRDLAVNYVGGGFALNLPKSLNGSTLTTNTVSSSHNICTFTFTGNGRIFLEYTPAYTTITVS